MVSVVLVTRRATLPGRYRSALDGDREHYAHFCQAAASEKSLFVFGKLGYACGDDASNDAACAAKCAKCNATVSAATTAWR